MNFQADQALDLTRELIKLRSQAGTDDPRPIAAHMDNFLRERGIRSTVLIDKTGTKTPISILALIQGDLPGPSYMFNACLDTAPVGDSTQWRYNPFGASDVDGWIYGRGAADSKAGAAMFAVLAAEWQKNRHRMAGNLFLTYDLDEHTGDFQGTPAALEKVAQGGHTLDGAVIGYDGAKAICVGARGFYRAKIIVPGKASHTGGRQKGDSYDNAVVRAADFVSRLNATAIASPEENPEFGPPSRTITAMHGGHGFSITPDRCEISVDCRLTPDYMAETAKAELMEAVGKFNDLVPGLAHCTVEDAMKPWPAYTLAAEHPLYVALADAVEKQGLPRPQRKVAGASNIGNLLAAHNVPALCGYGVNGRNIHAADEAFEVASLAPALASYRTMMQTLFTPR